MKAAIFVEPGGEYPVAKGLTFGHQPVAVIEKLGSAAKGYREGQRVLAPRLQKG